MLAVYVQPFDISVNAPPYVNASTPRNSFNLTGFADDVGFGIPVAANYFLVASNNSATTTSGNSGSTTASGSPSTSTAKTGAASCARPTIGVLGGIALITFAFFLESGWF